MKDEKNSENKKKKKLKTKKKLKNKKNKKLKKKFKILTCDTTKRILTSIYRKVQHCVILNKIGTQLSQK